MSKESQSSGATIPKSISLDTWSVVVALILALLVRLGIIQKVPW